jgi:hypothetical protein
MCASFAGPWVDEAVVQAFFEAIAPTQLDVLEEILAEQAAEQARLNQHWQEGLKRAEYEAGLAQRRYNQVDPDNRLVAAELEHQWEEKLRHWQTSREAYERFQQLSITHISAKQMGCDKLSPYYIKVREKSKC